MATLKNITKEERCVLALAEILCRETLSIEVFFRTIRDHNRKALFKTLEKFERQGFIFCGYETVECCAAHEEIEQYAVAPDQHQVGRILKSLVRNMKTEPLIYCRSARLFLIYLREEQSAMVAESQELSTLFANVLTVLMPYYEVSVRGTRTIVHRLEERQDYQLLEYAHKMDIGPSHDAEVTRWLGELYNEHFYYEMAERFFLYSESLTGETPELMMSRAYMYENQGYLARAIESAHRAYLASCSDKKSRTYADACNFIARSCALAGDERASRKWLERIGYTSSDMQIIQTKEINALRYINDLSLAEKLLDEAELKAYTLYGADSPEHSRIFLYRSSVYAVHGKLGLSNKAYRAYIELNHRNYGFSLGGNAALFSVMINDKMAGAKLDEASALQKKMNTTVKDADQLIAPGVRLSMAIATSTVLYERACLHSDKSMLKLAKEKLDEARSICTDLKPIEGHRQTLREVFGQKVIPDYVTILDAERLVEEMMVKVLTALSRYKEALQRIENFRERESEPSQRLMWNCQKGLVLGISGKLYIAQKIWQDTINTAQPEDKFNILTTVATMQYQCGYTELALHLYDEAFTHEYEKYATESDRLIAREWQNLCKSESL